MKRMAILIQRLYFRNGKEGSRGQTTPKTAEASSLRSYTASQEGERLGELTFPFIYLFVYLFIYICPQWPVTCKYFYYYEVFLGFIILQDLPYE